MSRETVGIDWPQAYMLPLFQMVTHLTVYDLRGTARDVQLSATIIAGIVNRPQPSVYLITGDDEAFWLQQVLSAVPQDHEPAHGMAAFYALCIAAMPRLRGVIIYDPALLDTINVATTLAGQQDGVVMAPTLAEEIQARFALPTLHDLRIYHWSSRLQAYRWAQQHLLGTASARIIAGLNPDAFCGLRSFLVATGAFVYWLDTRIAGPDQVAERALLAQFLGGLAPGAIHLGWVIHEPSAVALCSRFAIPVIASDYITNLEVWTAVPATVSPPIAPVEVARPVEKKVYVSFTMSDGDNLQYCQHRLQRLWHDRARGNVPIGWTFSPLLAQCMPALAAYYTRTATVYDELMGSPSGLGYMYPSRWPHAELVPYLRQSGQLMQQLAMTTLELFDIDTLHSTGLPLLGSLSLTGMELLNTVLQQEVATTLRPYGIRAILSGVGYTGHPATWKNVADVTIYHNPGFTDSPERTLQLIRAASLLFRRRPLFLNIYLVAWSMNPTGVQQVMSRLGPDYRFVLPRTLLSMVDSQKKP